MKTIANNEVGYLDLTIELIGSGVIPVFDMDEVIADATHRQILNPDGSLNLVEYRKKSTREHIEKDKPLPLIEVAQFLTKRGIPFYLCTARVVCEPTREWLARHDVKPTGIFCRDGETDTRKDWKLKVDKLAAAFNRAERKNMMLIDDNLQNCQAVEKIGMQAIRVEV